MQTTIDIAASGPETGTVRRTQVINMDCPHCGRESLLPEPGGGRDAPFVCGGCADDAYHARQAEADESDLRLRDAAAFIGEALGGYDHPLGNPMLRPRHRVAER